MTQTTQTNAASMMALPGAVRRPEPRDADASAGIAAEDDFATRLHTTLRAADESISAEDRSNALMLRKRRKAALQESAGSTPSGPGTVPFTADVRHEQAGKLGANRPGTAATEAGNPIAGNARRTDLAARGTEAQAPFGDATLLAGEEAGDDRLAGKDFGARLGDASASAPSADHPSLASAADSKDSGAVMASEPGRSTDAGKLAGLTEQTASDAANGISTDSTGSNDSTGKDPLQSKPGTSAAGIGSADADDATIAGPHDQSATLTSPADADPATTSMAATGAPAQASGKARSASAGNTKADTVATTRQTASARPESTTGRPDAPTAAQATTATSPRAAAGNQTTSARTTGGRDGTVNSRRSTDARNAASDTDPSSARVAGTPESIRGATANAAAQAISPAAAADSMASFAEHMSAGRAESADTAPGDLSELAELPAIETQLDPALVSDEFQGQLGERVISAIRNDMNSAEIRVTPQELGPVRIDLTMDGDTAHVTFSAEHGATRQALQDTLPNLRDMLATEGWQLGQADVRDDRGAGQMADQRQQQADARRSDTARGGDPLAEQASPDHGYRPAGGARGLVDLFA